MNKSVRIGLSAVLAGSMLVSVGCSSKPSATPGTSSPKAGGTLNVGLQAEPPKMDPSLSSALVDRQVMASIYDKLIDLKTDGTLEGMLAEKWQVSDDKKVYTFSLRKGVKFQDGTDFNADAVKFNFDRNMKKESSRKTELSSVDKVEVVDPNTVKVTLKQPFAPFLSVLADRAGMMVSPDAVKKSGDDFVNHPVGTGPFKFVERVKGDHITVEKNQDYWQKGLPKLDKIVYKGIPDGNIQLVNLKSGQLDVIDTIPTKDMEALKSEGKYTIVNEAGFGYQGIHVNDTKPPFDKKELREAVDMLIDRDTVVKVVLNNVGVPGGSPFSASSLAYGDSDKPVKGTVEQAKALLAKAGKPDGFSFTLKIGTSPTNQQLGQVIQNMLKPAGIDMKLERVEFGTLLEQADKKNFEAVQLGWSGRLDPDQNIYDFFVTGGKNNYSGFSNPDIDKSLNEARVESDNAKRKAIYDKIMNTLHDEVPYIFLYHQANTFGLQKSVQGFQYYPDGILRTVNLTKN